MKLFLAILLSTGSGSAFAQQVQTGQAQTTSLVNSLQTGKPTIALPSCNELHTYFINVDARDTDYEEQTEITALNQSMKNLVIVKMSQLSNFQLVNQAQDAEYILNVETFRRSAPPSFPGVGTGNGAIHLFSQVELKENKSGQLVFSKNKSRSMYRNDFNEKISPIFGANSGAYANTILDKMIKQIGCGNQSK